MKIRTTRIVGMSGIPDSAQDTTFEMVEALATSNALHRLESATFSAGAFLITAKRTLSDEFETWTVSMEVI